jgi:hypothetical protein
MRPPHRQTFGLKSRRRLGETYLATPLSAGVMEYTLLQKPNRRLDGVFEAALAPRNHTRNSGVAGNVPRIPRLLLLPRRGRRARGRGARYGRSTLGPGSGRNTRSPQAGRRRGRLYRLGRSTGCGPLKPGGLIRHGCGLSCAGKRRSLNRRDSAATPASTPKGCS